MATSFDSAVYAVFTAPSVSLSVTTNSGAATVNTTAGTYTIDSFLTQLVTDLDSQAPVSGGSWTGTLSAGAVGSTGKVTLSVDVGTYSITWGAGDGATLEAMLGFTANITAQTTSTGSAHAGGLWLPDCPLAIGGDYKTAARRTDLRQSITPTGLAFGHVSNVSYRHMGLKYSHVPAGKVWIAQESVSGESLEKFLADSQWGEGNSWFSVSSRVKVLGPAATYVGGNTVAYWSLIGVGSLDDVIKRVDAWDGLWSVEFPTLVSDGS